MGTVELYQKMKRLIEETNEESSKLEHQEKNQSGDLHYSQSNKITQNKYIKARGDFNISFINSDTLWSDRKG